VSEIYGRLGEADAALEPADDLSCDLGHSPTKPWLPRTLIGVVPKPIGVTRPNHDVPLIRR
jgi:hypothetical protein